MGAKVQKKQKRMISKTYSQKQAEISRNWWVIDAGEMSLGRLCSEIAKVVSGRSKVSFTPNVDGGDYVIVTNAQDLVVTGAKKQNKMYRHHSGYMGGLKEFTLDEVLKRDPDKAIERAVYGMLPKNKLRPQMLQRLKVYPGPEHKHAAQNPTAIKLNGNAKIESKA